MLKTSHHLIHLETVAGQFGKIRAWRLLRVFRMLRGRK